MSDDDGISRRKFLKTGAGLAGLTGAGVAGYVNRDDIIGYFKPDLDTEENAGMREKIISMQPAPHELNFEEDDGRGVEDGLRFSLENMKALREIGLPGGVKERRAWSFTDIPIHHFLDSLYDFDAILSSQFVANAYKLNEDISDFEDRVEQEMDESGLIEHNDISLYEGRLPVSEGDNTRHTYVAALPEENIVLESIDMNNNLTINDGYDAEDKIIPSIRAALGEIETLDEVIPEYFEQDFFDENVVVDMVGGSHQEEYDRNFNGQRIISGDMDGDPGYLASTTIYDEERSGFREDVYKKVFRSLGEWEGEPIDETEVVEDELEEFRSPRVFFSRTDP